VTQAQHEIVASIIDMVEHDQSRRAEMNRLRADALRAVLARALASGGLVKYYQGASYTAERERDEAREALANVKNMGAWRKWDE
jgi:predicted methyltransferase